MDWFNKHRLWLMVFSIALPATSFAMDNKVIKHGQAIEISLEEVDKGSKVVTSESLLPLTGLDKKEEVIVPLKWVRYSATLEELLKDTNIVLIKENEKFSIQQVPVTNVKKEVIDCIFNTLVPALDVNNLNLFELCGHYDISFIIDLMIVTNYLDIKKGLLKKLIDYCVERISNAPEANNIEQILNDIPPALLRLLCKALAGPLLYPIKVEKPLAVCKGHIGVVNSVCVLGTKEGIRIISGSSDTTIRIWDMSGNQLAVCNGHTESVLSVCAIETKEGTRIISGSSDTTIRIWDMNGNQLAICNGHTGFVLSVCVLEAHDGVRIISGSMDSTLRIWDMNGKELAIYKGHFLGVGSVCSIKTKEGIRIISSSWDKTIRIWDMSCKQVIVFKSHLNLVQSVCALETEEGIRIISVLFDKTIRIWSMSGKELAICKGHVDSVSSVCALKTEEGARIISGSGDNTLCVWDMNGNQLAICSGHINSVDSVCALETKEGIRIISGSRDETICIWSPFSVMEKFKSLDKEEAKKMYTKLCLLFKEEKSQRYDLLIEFFKDLEKERIEKEKLKKLWKASFFKICIENNK